MNEDDTNGGDGPPDDDSGAPVSLDPHMQAGATSGGGDGGPDAAAMAVWDQVIADMETTAAEYREDGWDVLTLEPGDVTVRSGGERVGLDVLVPNDEFERLQSLLSGGVELDGCQVFRATNGSVVFLVVAMEDPDTETAVVYPAYYDATDPDAAGLMRRARAEGELRSYLRILTGEYVEMTHGDPSLFVPGDEE